MPDIPKDYIALRHVACGKLAFYVHESWWADECRGVLHRAVLQLTFLEDGSRPIEGKPVCCSSCRKYLRGDDGTWEGLLQPMSRLSTVTLTPEAWDELNKDRQPTLLQMAQAEVAKRWANATKADRP